MDGARKADERRGAAQAVCRAFHENPFQSTGLLQKELSLYEQGRIDLVWRDWQLWDGEGETIGSMAATGGSAFSFRVTNRAQEDFTVYSTKEDAWRRFGLTGAALSG